MFMTLVKKSPISITVSRSGFDAFMAMLQQGHKMPKLGQFRDEIVSVSFLWDHRATVRFFRGR